MENIVFVSMAIMNVCFIIFIIFRIYKKDQQLKDYRNSLKKGDIVIIKSETYPACRIMEMVDNKFVVSLIVPKEFVHKSPAEIVDDFD